MFSLLLKMVFNFLFLQRQLIHKGIVNALLKMVFDKKFQLFGRQLTLVCKIIPYTLLKLLISTIIL